MDNRLLGMYICVPSRLSFLLVEIFPNFSSICCEPNVFPEIFKLENSNKFYISLKSGKISKLKIQRYVMGYKRECELGTDI